MRYSRLFGKTTKTEFRDATLASHQLLLRGGFIRESVAGRYYFLPLGWRVHERIKAIIKEEMDAAGAQEMIAPTLHPLELWEETNRTTSASFELMRVTDRREGKFALGGTAEEMFVDLVRKLKPFSHRDLPFNVYQFSTKFRDEMRARGGLLRLREFVMKDAYSFHADEADFKREYDVMAEVYTRVFARMGLDAHKVEADNGYIGGDYCHEYQVESPVGEGSFFVGPDGYAAHEDVATFARDAKNLDEELLPMQMVDLPTNVRTIDDLVRHYDMPAWRFLKNVVFKDRVSRQIIIAVIRGDLEVNKTKIEQLLDIVGQLEDATHDDLAKLGTKSGFVHSWGLNAKYIGDLSLTSVHNFYGGQKTETTDPINVNYGRDFECEMLVDIALAYDGAPSESGHGALAEKRGIEVGNIFQLGTHYTDLMKGAVYADADGTEKPFYMGCYGIGLARTLATIVEQFHDDRGIIWPASIAPYHISLINLGKPNDAVTKKCEELYTTLGAKWDVLLDDRDARAGEKFADADLVGCPVRIVVSEKTLAEESVEVKLRKKGDAHLVKLEGLTEALSKMF